MARCFTFAKATIDFARRNASSLAAAGIDVALFEQGRIAHSQAARAAGIVVHEHEPFFYKLAKQHGVRDARHIFQTVRRGSLEYLSAVKRLRIECGLQIRDAIHFSSSQDGIQELLRPSSFRVIEQLSGVPCSSIAPPWKKQTRSEISLANPIW